MESGPFRTLAKTLGTDTSQSAIVGIVSKLLTKCGQTSAPIELRAVTEELGINVQWERVESNGSGVASLSSHNDKLVVKFYEKSLANNWRRTRFTVAHEIIHAAIVKVLADPLLISALDGSCDSYKHLERLCDIGAAELLMPKTLFRQQLHHGPLTSSRLRELYDTFMVSREALLLRVAETLPKGSVTRWRKFSRDNRESCCFRVVSSYPSYAPTGKSPWLPEGATSKHVIGFPDHLETLDEGLIIQKRPMRIKLGNKQWEGQGYFTRWPTDRTIQPAFRGFSVPDEENTRQDSDYYLVFSE